MILRFTQAVSQQPLTIMSDAITAVVASPYDDATCFVHTGAGFAFHVLGTVAAISADLERVTDSNAVAIGAIGG